MDDPKKVTGRLIKHATQRLAYYTGGRYKDIALKCLTGDFGEGDQVQSLARQVTEVLRKELK
jgi:hypothetical protein